MFYSLCMAASEKGRKEGGNLHQTAHFWISEWILEIHLLKGKCKRNETRKSFNHVYNICTHILYTHKNVARLKGGTILFKHIWIKNDASVAPEGKKSILPSTRSRKGRFDIKGWTIDHSWQSASRCEEGFLPQRMTTSLWNAQQIWESNSMFLPTPCPRWDRRICEIWFGGLKLTAKACGTIQKDFNSWIAYTSALCSLPTPHHHHKKQG